MATDCWSLLKAGTHRAARRMRHGYPTHHHGVHAHRVPGGHPAAAAPPGCRDTDAPYRALHSSPGPAMHGPTPDGLGRSIAGVAAKAAGLLAASSAAGAGAGLGYRSFAGAQQTAGARPTTAPQTTLDSSPSIAHELNTAHGLSLGLPSLTMPGITLRSAVPDNATPVAEPSSALILAVGLLSVVLVRHAAWRRTPRQRRLAAGRQL